MGFFLRAGKNAEMKEKSIKCFVHPILSSFVFWNLVSVDAKERSFDAKRDQKPKTKNRMNETLNTSLFHFCILASSQKNPMSEF